MKKRVLILVLVALVCLAFCSAAYARGGLGCYSSVKSGNSYATIEAFSTENLYVQFNVYKIVGGSEVFQTSGSSSKTGISVTAKSTKSLTSGNYVMYIYGYGNTTTVNTTRYYSI